MKLTCFGKYGPYPKGGTSCSCYMITSKGKNVIIDLGCGGLTRVFASLGVEDIHAVVLSHLHADHMGDMLTLRYALATGKKLGKISDPVPVYLPEQPAAEAGLITAHPMVDAKYITDGKECRIFDMDVRFALMPHAVPSYAMSFSAGGKKFVYSGDTEDNDTLAVFAKDADLFLMEGAFLSKDKPEDAVHVSAKEAGRIGRDAGAKRLLITHVFPEYDEQDILRDAQVFFPDAEMIEEQHTYEV